MRIYYCPGSDLLILDTKTERSKKDKGKLQSWIKVLGYFKFLGRFPIHTYPAPPLTPQTTLDACFQSFFSQFELCIGRGRENYKKISKRMHVLLSI